MGAIGGLLGVGGGAGGSGFGTTTTGVTPQALANAQQGVQAGLGNQQALLNALQAQNGLQNQSNVYGQLQNIAAGQGPNPAQAMLNQATGQNVANQAALMAGQRGAAQNVGLMARQAAQQGANIQQQAAGQGATMQANQALNAIGAAGNMANTMAANQIGATQGLTSAQLQGQQQLLNAQSAQNNVQGQLANTTMQGQQGLIGGGLNAAGAAFGLAGGGQVPQYADGGVTPGAMVAPTTGPQSSVGQYLQSVQGGFNPGTNQGASDLQSSLSDMGDSIRSKKDGANKGLANAQQQFFQNFAGPSVSMAGMAKGGNVGSKLKSGGHVPGQAKVKGDSLKNDTVNAKLSPGEIVIPRSVVNSKDPVRGSAEFVRAVLAKKGAR